VVVHTDHSHYDWWAFPISDASSHGLKYSVYAEEVKELKKDPVFISRFRTGLKLLAESWGWDIYAAEAIPADRLGPDQEWQQWGVR
jgi:hypothetical protein